MLERTGNGWKAAALDAIPPDWEQPVGSARLTEEEAYELVVARDPGAGERWREFEQAWPDIWERFRDHGIRRYFGLRAFGVAAFTSQAGDPAIVPHSEAMYGYDQEELYVVLRGRARFRLGDDTFEVDQGGMVFVRPEIYREAFALATPTTLLVIGGVPGHAYDPPPFQLDPDS
jgi:mannose-6-phosphate isomerase-like protein (cupin superfamily)